MVVGSSLRRHPKTLRSGKTRTDPDLPPTLLPLRAKRNRAPSLQDRDQENKRRKLVASKAPPQLRIPLRARAPVPEPDTGIATPPKSIDSPTLKPQYDQIRIIEERARASIRDASFQATSHDERRKLRSEHGGSRSKTELAQYFPTFEEMLSLDPPDPEILTGKTKIILIDDTPDYEPPPPRADPFGSHKPLHNVVVLDLSKSTSTEEPAASDPLIEDEYLKIHRKAERHEKQMKNGDRERAQHERYQLERLLADLRGPDWLKTLGISGITDTEKKRYEPKRLLFIRETQALIDKFKWWKEEEKRRKAEKDQAQLEEAAELEEAEAEGVDVEESEEAEESSRSSSTQPPNSSEIDALASQQLLEEAKSASKRKKMTPELPPPPPPPVYRPFTSFFEKRHLRDAAVSGRQRGRTVLAFGLVVPDLEEHDFQLPESILTEDAIRASQRSRRRRKRDEDE